VTISERAAGRGFVLGSERLGFPRHPDRRRRIRGAVAAAPRDERAGPRPL